MVMHQKRRERYGTFAGTGLVPKRSRVSGPDDSGLFLTRHVQLAVLLTRHQLPRTRVPDACALTELLPVL